MVHYIMTFYHQMAPWRGKMNAMANILSKLFSRIGRLFGGKPSAPQTETTSSPAPARKKDDASAQGGAGARKRSHRGGRGRGRERGEGGESRPQDSVPAPSARGRGGHGDRGGRLERRDSRQEPRSLKAGDYSEDESGVKSAHAEWNKKPVGDWAPPPVEAREEGAAYFQDYPLDRPILRAVLDDLGFKRCTPIQAKALPIALQGLDIAGKAQTGTGKTAVFLMSMLQQFIHSEEKRALNQPFALVLAPTRELALQIAHDAENLSVYTSLRTVAVFGGMDYERQRRLLQAGCDLVVATPGRLIDYLQHHVIDTAALKVLVIDEADRMLDMGFIPDVKRIINYLPPREQRQTMLFSATLSHDIMNLASRWMRPDPAVVEIEPETVVASGINETVYACTTKEKLAVMLWVLNHEECGRVLIFRNRKCDVEELAETLRRCGIKCEMLSGDVSQNRRLNILEDFRTGKVKVVVATDVAGRGIQVDGITHVFNYDLPYEAEDYVHRVGRTARAGHQGRAISFASEDCAFVIPDIEEYIGRALPITQPEDEMLRLPEGVRSPAGMRPRSHSHGGGGHGRPGPHRR